MKLITSGENPFYKAVMQLKQKKHRDEQKSYLIEGPNLIREALQNGVTIETVIRSVDFTEEAMLREEIDPEKMQVNGAILPESLFRKLSDTEHPQGILAVVKKKTYSEQEFFGIEVSPSDNVIVLDRLQDPGNIGTILRTADAAGFMGAIILKGTADLYSAKIVRAATGSLFRLPVLFADTPEETIRLLRHYGKNLVCTALSGSKDYYDVSLSEHAAIIIGNEGNGVCREFQEQSDLLVQIPMEGTIESLNAAVSASILMYESVRQRRLK